VLRGDELVKYLNAPPLDVPDDYSPEAAFRKGVETGDWSELECAARKACRLMIEAARKSPTVKRWLLETKRMGDQAWNRLMMAIGRETPEIGREINRLRPGAEVLWWAAANAALVVRESKLISEEKQRENGE